MQLKTKKGFYTVGDQNFPSLCFSNELVVQAFHDAGFYNVSLSHVPDSLPDIRSCRFLKGTRV